MDLCRVIFEHDGDALVARLSGEVDLSNAAFIGEHVRARVANHSLGVILDLAELTYLDSSGLEVIFDLRKRLESRRQELEIRVPGDSPVRRTLELVDLVEGTPGQAAQSPEAAPVTGGAPPPL